MNRYEFASAACRRQVVLAFARRQQGSQSAAFLHVDGFLAVPTPLLRSQRAILAELSLKHRLPGMFEPKENVEAGCLMSYFADLADLTRRAAAYIDKILKGAKPGDLPVEQASKYELTINLKTAKALGLTIPPSLLLRADPDQVIQ